MENMITIAEALDLPNPLFIDLRSPVEYEEAHIPGAINIPIFEDEERALIGTIYKEKSPEQAVDEGFSLVAPKLPEIQQRIKKLSKEYNVVLYCWRGGMRSQSISQVLALLGNTHYRLIDGYKSFRQYVLDFFNEPFPQKIIVLHGLTGVGKTELLDKLKSEGLPAIDLEGLAQNRGSVFGHVGMGKAPSQKQFEGWLFLLCHRFRNQPCLMVECESKRVGNIILPANFFAAMQMGRRILIYDSMENRIKRLIATYTLEENPDNLPRLAKAIERLRQRLGHTKVNHLLQALEERDYLTVVEQLLVDYYDPLYRYPDGPSPGYELSLNSGLHEETYEKLKDLLIKYNDMEVN